MAYEGCLVVDACDECTNTRSLRNVLFLCSLQHCACSGYAEFAHPVIGSPALLALSRSPVSLYFISLMFKILFNGLKSSKANNFYETPLCV